MRRPQMLLMAVVMFAQFVMYFAGLSNLDVGDSVGVMFLMFAVVFMELSD